MLDALLKNLTDLLEITQIKVLIAFLEPVPQL